MSWLTETTYRLNAVYIFLIEWWGFPVRPPLILQTHSLPCPMCFSPYVCSTFRKYILTYSVSIFICLTLQNIWVPSALLSFHGVRWLDVKDWGNPPGLPGTLNCVYTFTPWTIHQLTILNLFRIRLHLLRFWTRLHLRPPILPSLWISTKYVENTILSEYHESEDNKECNSLLPLLTTSSHINID